MNTNLNKILRTNQKILTLITFITFITIFVVSTLGVATNATMTDATTEKVQILDINEVEPSMRDRVDYITYELPIIRKEYQLKREASKIIAINISDLNVRNLASTKGGVVETLPKGTKIECINSVVNGEWVELFDETNGKRYISNKYIVSEERYVEMQEEAKVNVSQTSLSRGYNYNVETTFTSNSSIYLPSGYLNRPEELYNIVSQKYPLLVDLVYPAIEAERNYGVNAKVTIAIACHESGNGKYLANTYNYFGLRSSSWLAYSSPSDCVNRGFIPTILNIESYSGDALSSINRNYCPGDGGYWANKVTYFVNQL